MNKRCCSNYKLKGSRGGSNAVHSQHPRSTTMETACSVVKDGCAVSGPADLAVVAQQRLLALGVLLWQRPRRRHQRVNHLQECTQHRGTFARRFAEPCQPGTLMGLSSCMFLMCLAHCFSSALDCSTVAGQLHVAHSAEQLPKSKCLSTTTQPAAARPVITSHGSRHYSMAAQEHLKVDGHVAEGLGAQGAGVVVACVLPKAVRVHEVPAR